MKTINIGELPAMVDAHARHRYTLTVLREIHPKVTVLATIDVDAHDRFKAGIKVERLGWVVGSMNMVG